MSSRTGERAARESAAPFRRRLVRVLVPRSASGMAAIVFFMGIASAFTGTVLFAYYENRLDATEREVSDFAGGFEESLESARQVIETEQAEAVTEIRGQLDELEEFSATGETLDQLVEQVGPGVWFVATLGDAGEPSVGSAFVVFSDTDRSYLLTSYHVVRAATRAPGPDISLRKGDEELPAELITWEEGRDLALLAIDRVDLPRLEWAEGSPAVETGDRVLAFSGLGAAGAEVTQGFVADVSANGIQHDAAVGAAFQCGPLVDSDGRVLGVTSRTYTPLGFDPLAVFFAVPIRDACAEVLSCPDGDPAGPPG
ncbi:hypothetical protein BH24ACT3_BH24ACT3_15550 [soil metagenome]